MTVVATERLDGRDLARGEPIVAVHGPAVDDVFVGLDHVIRGLREALWEELSRSGYQRIVFSTLREPVFYLDSESRESSRAGAAPATNAAPGKMRPGFTGPMGDRRVTAAAPGATGPGAVDTIGTGPLVPVQPGPGLSDEHRMWMFDAFLRRTDIPTAVVILQAKEQLRHLGAVRTFAGMLAEWIERPGATRNVCVLVFRDSDLSDVVEFAAGLTTVPSLAGYLAEPARTGAMPRIGYPREEELRRLVELVRLRDGLRVDWLSYTTAVRVMAGANVPLRTWQLRLSELVVNGGTFGLDELRRRGWVTTALADGRSPWTRLEEMPGLEPAKRRLKELRSKLENERSRAAAGRGLDREPDSLHMVFTGNPGTGKTTVARLFGEILRDLGVLRSGHVIEVRPDDLAAGYRGQSGHRTNRFLDQALDGVLFIDEAYQLADDANFMESVRAQLVARMENDRDRLVVIIAGYRSPIDEMLRSNIGLPSRFNEHNRIDFPDLGPDELHAVLLRQLERQGVEVPAPVAARYAELVTRMHADRDDTFGNARAMRDLASAIVTAWASRVGADVDQPVSADDLPAEAKLQLDRPAPPVEDVLADLDGMVGLEPVKSAVRGLYARSELSRRRGIAAPVAPHLLFVGNPGTGKTTVAELIGRMFTSLGLLRRGHVVTVGAADLVGQYEGQTLERTMARIREATDGVLFIDEAYSLARDSRDLYGRQVLDTLTMQMDRLRGRLVVIAAGYPEPMDRFLAANEGLRYRFAQRIEFPDYATAELVAMLRAHAVAAGVTLDPGAEAAAARWLDQVRRSRPTGFGNGRTVRGLWEAMDTRLSERVLRDDADARVMLTQDVPDVD